jgi:hypothetical protein
MNLEARDKKKDRKFHYDEQDGIFVFEEDISINWLISQVLRQPDLQITKISNDQLHILLKLLDESDLRLPNGQHGLFWLSEKIKEKLLLAEGQQGEVWHDICTRYKFIIEQIDQVLAATSNIKEKMEIKKEDQGAKRLQRIENRLQAHFEPLKEQNDQH